MNRDDTVLGNEGDDTNIVEELDRGENVISKLFLDLGEWEDGSVGSVTDHSDPQVDVLGFFEGLLESICIDLFQSGKGCEHVVSQFCDSVERGDTGDGNDR